MMEFIDLRIQQKRIKTIVDQRIQKVLRHGIYINGPEVQELEGCLASYVGSRFAIGCASGTDALLMSLLAYGIGHGDAIFTTPFTFIATAEVISLLGATPIFVDIDPNTFNIDPEKIEVAVEALLLEDCSLYPLPFTRTPLSPKGIIAVDIFGLPADYNRITAIAKTHGLFVIEDAAQSFGAKYNGKRSCSLADIACTSFFPAKPLGCYGDGGMCFTDDDGLADLLRSIRGHGAGSDKYDNLRIGVNGRLDTLQAAILLAKFEIFEEEVKLRQQKSAQYTKGIEPMSEETPPILVQHVPVGYSSVWAQYSILASDMGHRNALQSELNRFGIPTAIYYPKPLHLQRAFSSLAYRENDFPISENLAKRIFSLPMHPYLREQDQKRVIEALYSMRELTR